jgi:hypothetical protein
MTDWLCCQPKNGEALQQPTEQREMDQNRQTIHKIREEFIKYEKAIEELRFLKLVSEDLKNFKKMINLQKFD